MNKTVDSQRLVLHWSTFIVIHVPCCRRTHLLRNRVVRLNRTLPVKTCPRLCCSAVKDEHNEKGPQLKTVALGTTVKAYENSSFNPLARTTNDVEKISTTASEHGVFFLIILNLLVFLACRFLNPSLFILLSLNHAQPKWWQFITYSFCHQSWSHLSNNLFFLFIFGKLVEEREGTWGIIISYLVCAVGSSFVSWFILPKYALSVGASGAVFGLFTISVLIRFSLSWRRLIEFIIVGQFVVERLGQEVRSLNWNKTSTLTTNHIGHIAGAVTGFLLVLLLRVIVSAYSKERLENDGKR
eukprot:jgi/Galph1/4777/GphlegSOOS_G3437.1